MYMYLYLKANENKNRAWQKNPKAKLGEKKNDNNKLDDEKNHEARFASRVQKNRLMQVIQTQKVVSFFLCIRKPYKHFL